MARRKAREVALKVLFQMDLGRHSLEGAWPLAVEGEALPEASASFARELAAGAASHQGEIDRLLSECSEGWKVSRMAGVDRNILRLAAYELLYRQDIPASATINEAVELAKTYGTEESPRFVNGVLGELARRLGRVAAPAG
ncbi:MAG: transcription antitermination factor NusB [Bacillota bacterium]|nr:transcription antitermination factor NusB [Bacillota bacterium]MDI7248487.1 transcription antitermination factor NusB [Bacillota bacterium]